MEIMKTSTVFKTCTNRANLWKIASISLLAICALIFMFSSNVQVARKSLLISIAAFVMIGHNILPTGPIDRPLGFLWKTVRGLSLFYLCALIYMFFQSRQQAIQTIVTYVDPKLNLINYQQVSYGQDCRIIKEEHPNPYQNLAHACFDIFALAHFLGWFFKTLICRDLKLIFFASVSFELIEYSLRNVLNNFKECWWDHVIIDIFGCNLLGIICGFIVIDKFGLERYRWSLRDAPLAHSHWTHLKQFWMRWDLSHLETKTFSNLKNYLKMVFFLILFQINDLAIFFVKYIYHVPPNHIICAFRLWVIGLLCVNAVRQYFDFMRNQSKFRKTNLLLLLGIIFTQYAIVVKQNENLFDNAFFDERAIFFLSSLFLLFLIGFIKIGISDLIRKKKQRQSNKKLKQLQEHQNRQYAKSKMID